MASIDNQYKPRTGDVLSNTRLREDKSARVAARVNASVVFRSRRKCRLSCN